MFQSLHRGRLDAVLIDLHLGRYLLKLYGSSGYIAAHPFTVHTNEVHIMLSKKSVSVRDAEIISEAVGKFRGSAGYRAILNKYTR
ncbi:MAG: hypothetical protein JKY60_15920 [Kordiimonadaceae bacterium]|nr:hypothetical protein [Kordiimonadaceae bacterium]